MAKFLGVIFFLVASFSIFAQSGSTIPQPTIWLKAESINDSLQLWSDMSGNGYNLSLPAQEMFSESKINFNPSIKIDTLESALKVNYQPKPSAEITVFAVYNAEASKDQYGIWAIQLDSVKTISLSTQKIKDMRGNVTEYCDSTESVPLINLFRNKWINKPVDTLISGINILGNDTLPFKGSFAEFIYYDNGLTFEELSKVYTYLAIKYGISIYKMNYINSDDEIIWNFEENSEFANEVAGIGCDTLLGINQKQSCALGGEATLTMYTGEMADLNAENTQEIAHKDFLIWSDNGMALSFENIDSLSEELHNSVSSKKWTMTRSGSTANQINCKMIMNAPILNDSILLILLINREKDFTFPINTTELVYPDYIDTLGNYYFSNIFWDSDSSGSDAFAFQYFNLADLNLAENNYSSQQEDDDDDFYSGIEMTDNSGRNTESTNNSQQNSNPNSTNNLQDPTNNTNSEQAKISSFSVYPNPSRGDFNIDAILDNVSDLNLTITDANGRLIQIIRLDGSSIYSTKGHIPVEGCYVIKAETAKESKTVKIIIQ